MAHGPSPFGVPQRDRAPSGAGGGRTGQSRVDRPEAHPPRARLGPETVPRGGRRSPEEELEEHLERIQASRPLRRAAQRARRRTRWWLIALAVVSGLAVVAACGAGAYIVLREGEPAPEATGAPSAEGAANGTTEEGSAPEAVDPIEERRTDPEPIAVAELFGDGPITPEGGAGAYEVLAADELADCAEAGLDALAELLAESDCTQVVRATVVSPDGEFAATAGVLNLADAAEAEALREAIEEGVEGGFAALRTDGAGSELGRAKTMLGYNDFGHFLMYVVVGRVDGEALEEADEPVLTVVRDVVDVWLVDRLRPRRAAD